VKERLEERENEGRKKEGKRKTKGRESNEYCASS
jgi:hypothetical protein